jgi:ATP-dependent helicase/DNAse subunit B
VLAELAERFGPTRVFSPTALEHYVACPFRFFLEDVLRLDPLEEPEEAVESTRRGAAVHRALSRLHRRLAGRPAADPVAADVTEQLLADLDAAVEESVERAPSPASKELWRLEGRRLRRAAVRYAGQWRKFVEPWRPHGAAPRPTHFEADFGLPDAPHEALRIAADGGEVRVGGRIDRVDLAELPDGGVGFWVIDYKTGRSANYSAADLTSLRRLQLTLYALAVERVFLAGRPARPLGLAYWLVTDTGPKSVLPAGRQPTAWLGSADSWHAFRARLERWVAGLASHIRAGDFPLAPRDEDCTDTCPYAQVCRISQSRRTGKAWALSLPAALLPPSPLAGEGTE